jgi:cysteinyl-tRNA synthetase
MSEKFLGPEFDIHGGGQDLIFPHHENEIAQSTCTGGFAFAKYWMHNGYLMAEGEKMSKSLGNFYTVHELLDEFPGEAIRLALLKTHYRQPLDFTKDGLAEAKRELDGFYGALRGVDASAEAGQETPDIIEAMSDDLNTPLALSHLHELAGDLNKAEGGQKPEAGSRLLSAAWLLGLLGQDPEAWFKGEASEGGLDDATIDALIAERDRTRENKEFKRGDEIRDQLEARGILLEDGAQGTTWKRK